MARNNNFVKKIARFNSTKAQQNKKPVSKQEETLEVKKRWPKYLLGFLIAGILVSGITIPLVVAANRAKEDYPVLDKNSVVFKFKNKDGSISQIEYSDLKQAVDSVNEGKYVYSKVSDEIALYLYEQEYKASAWYEAIYNSNKVASKKKYFKLQSVKEIENNKARILDDLEQRLQTQFGFGKWETEFKTELAKPEYGSSKNKADAVKHLVAQEIRRNAFGRFQTEINSDFTVSEVENGLTAEHDVYYMFYNSQTQKEERVDLFKKGEVIRFGNGEKDLHFIHTSGNNQNVYIPKDKLNTTDPGETKVYAFLTKSFLNDKKDAGIYINDWLATQPIIYSKLNLKMTQNQTAADLPFSFSKQELIKLLTFTDFNNGTDDSQIDLPINRINNFKGISNFVKGENLTDEETKQAINDSLLLNVLGSANDNTYGSEGFKSLSDIYSSEKPEFYLPYISIINNDSIYTPNEKNNFFTDLKTKIIEKIFNNEQVYSSIINKQATSWSESEKELAINNNKKIADYINEMTDFDSKMGNLLRDLFAQSDSDYKTNLVYKINENYAILNSTGLNLLTLSTVNSEETARKLILSDLSRKANDVSTTALKPPFNIDNMFKDLLTSDFITKKVLEDASFVEYLKTLKYKNYSTDEEQNFSDNDVEVAKKYSKILLEFQHLQILNGKSTEIKEYIDSLIDKNLSADYVFKNGKWIVKNHGDKEFIKFIYPIFEKQINGGNK
ncbi:HinT-interacting membrane complex protein P80 [Mycoplasma zalophi]|uniref:HinT-interacting membrane complex protein P80 n=1 Tax=Mycoplasma zalophi TaxID=191287 RepID=UPI001C0FA9F4|nr:hypothetical protein [Mycoplasma zalophi]MBU4691150.1 hypothetical protein [Mycoplasma zalophi]